MNFEPTTVALLIGWVVLGLLICWVLDKTLNPWLSKRWIAKFKRDLAAGRIPRRPPSDHVIQFSSNGFTITRRKDNLVTATVVWPDVTGVQVFKRDLFSTDLICMAFALPGEMEVEISEDLDGWDELTRNLTIYLPGCRAREQWYDEVVLPAFETKLTRIFSRESKPTPDSQTTPPLAV